MGHPSLGHGAPMIAILLVLFVSAGNFALGFALAVHFGHGPAELPYVKNLLGKPQPHN